MLAFVRAAQRLPGITRIALIGSLTTNKANPKDADLLVSVTDDTDLTSLARLTRKLQGHAQTMNRGGEVFLADASNNYLGRICHWKECAPGIRMRCDALHCGQREYLHDDLEAITLAQSVLKETGETRKAYLLLSLPQQHVMSVSVYQLLLASVSIAFSLAGAVVGFVSATLAQAKNGPAQHMRVAAHQKLNRL